jgi:segregation and condensation protein B
VGWIKPKGRRQTPGRPVTWVTTEAFLEHFGLESLEALPGVEELKAAGLLDARPAISTLGAQVMAAMQGGGVAEDEGDEDGSEDEDAAGAPGNGSDPFETAAGQEDAEPGDDGFGNENADGDEDSDERDEGAPGERARPDA